MLIFSDISSIKSHLNKLKKKGNIIGFVPTMGALHNGHLSLIKKSISENNFTVVSIFVNPTQFDNSEDLRTYPSNIKNDISLIKSISNKIILFNPDPEEIYSDGIKSQQFNFNGLDEHMEGKYRQNHFQGVATVVSKLLSIVEPYNVYFGEKDFQQLRIIENLVFEKKINTKVIRCETLRDSDGLAFSSRNSKLSFSSKKMATNLFKALNFAKEKFNTLDVVEIEKKVIEQMKAHSEIKLDYFIIADEEKLEPSILKNNQKYRAFIAAYISGVRLIDNIKLY
jgi:pantoate--beta-alanine ligase